MLNTDALKQLFVEEQMRFADEEFQRIKRIYLSKALADQKATLQTLNSKLETLLMQYEAMQKQGIFGKLEYIQFSFLRTGLLDHHDPYRIDLYDSQWLLSDVECMVKWNAENIFDGFYELKTLLQERFKGQTRVREYYIDIILNPYVSKFYEIEEHNLKSLLKSFLVKLVDVADDVKIVHGDYLNQYKIIGHLR